MVHKPNAVILGMGGLGSAVAEELLKRGYNVIGTFHNAKPNMKKIKLYYLDMYHQSSIDTFIYEIRHKKIDVLVNTIANTLTFDRFEKIPIWTFEDDIIINYINFVYMLQKLIQNITGTIIIILSKMVDDAEPNYFSSYVCSKYALLGLAKCLKGEYKNKKIKIICPPMMDTKFVKNLPNAMKYDMKNPRDVAKDIVVMI